MRSWISKIVFFACWFFRAIHTPSTTITKYALKLLPKAGRIAALSLMVLMAGFGTRAMASLLAKQLMAAMAILASKRLYRRR